MHARTECRLRPLVDMCITALKFRWEQQDADRARAGDAWVESGLVFTTRHGTPIEPGNFNRSISKAQVLAQAGRLWRSNRVGVVQRGCYTLLLRFSAVVDA